MSQTQAAHRALDGLEEKPLGSSAGALCRAEIEQKEREVRQLQELQGTGTKSQFLHRLRPIEECWQITPLCLSFSSYHIVL